MEISKSKLELIKKTIRDLRKENAALKKRLSVLENHPSMVQGIRGETIVSKLLNGEITKHNSSFDINLPTKGILLEIKFSALNDAVRKSKSENKTKRWAWSKPFGESGQKVFDRLVLIGEKDQRYHNLYENNNCPYIFFDIWIYLQKKPPCPGCWFQ